MLSPRPSAPGASVEPGKPMRPMFGINPVLCDAQGNELHGNDTEGALCVGSIWPGVSRTVFGDHQRYLDTYFKPFAGYYFSGDGAHRYQIL